MNLAVHQHRIDDLAAIVDRHITKEVHVSGFTIDLDTNDVCAEGKRKILWLEEIGCRESGFSVGWQVFGNMSRKCDFLNRQTRLAFRLWFRQGAGGRLSDGNHRFGFTCRRCMCCGRGITTIAKG